MSKVVRTGTIYRMVGVLVAVIIALAIAVPKIAGSLIAQADAQDAEIAARPEAAAPVTAPPAAKPVVAPQAPVVFGAPTMPAAPVELATLQQHQPQTTSVSAPAKPAPVQAPTYQPTPPAPSSELGVDPNVTAPRVIPPKPQAPAKPAAPRGASKRAIIQ